MFKTLRSLKPNKRGGYHQIPALVYQSIAEILALPLANIFNESIAHCEFPDCYKIALVTPIYKRGDRANASNYRPISSLPIISKVFEKLLHQQLMTRIEKHRLLSTRQFGFRKHHSTEQLIQSLLHNWRTELDKPKPCYIAALSLDVQKAFDSIDHTLLLKKLTQFSLDDHCIKLIASYLSNRSQIMKVSNSFSNPLCIKTGVPQGSILGPLLFSIMVNDLLSTFPTSFAYADDTIVYTAAHSPQITVSKASKLITHMASWYDKNNLMLNLGKTSLCIFTNRDTNLSSYSITISDVAIKNQDHLMVLGVVLDPKLTFHKHIDKAIAKSNSLIYLFTKIRKYLDTDQAALTYKSIIRPVLEYCPSLLLILSTQSERKLERSQNIAIRIILRAPRQFSITSGRLILNIPTLRSRRLAYFHNFINTKLTKNRASCYIINVLQTMTRHTRSLRASSQLIKPFFRTNFGKASLPNLLYMALTTGKPELTFDSF